MRACALLGSALKMSLGGSAAGSDKSDLNDFDEVRHPSYDQDQNDPDLLLETGERVRTRTLTFEELVRQQEAQSYVEPIPEIEPEPEVSAAPWYTVRHPLWRKRMIRRPWNSPVAAMHLAAIRIQRAWRKCWLYRLQPSIPSGPSKQSPQAGRRRRILRPTTGELSEGAKQLRARYYALLREQAGAGADGKSMAKVGQAYVSFEHFCAAIIQGRWQSTRTLRRLQRVRQYASLKLYNVAAFEIQQWWRRCCGIRDPLLQLSEHLSLDPVVLDARRRDTAARRLQRAWRGACSYRHYRTLRDMIVTLHVSGEPCLLLRAALPREAMLLDPAMQAHVRFRLGGSRFPPSVYYKIYTHGAICDLGAFAPRNYIAEKANGGPVADGWYEREENNGWRPLVQRHHPRGVKYTDEVEKATAKKVLKNFHYNRLKRRQDVERQRRKRAIQWMRKLYGLDGEPQTPQPARHSTIGAFPDEEELVTPGVSPWSDAGDFSPLPEMEDEDDFAANVLEDQEVEPEAASPSSYAAGAAASVSGVARLHARPVSITSTSSAPLSDSALPGTLLRAIPVQRGPKRSPLPRDPLSSPLLVSSPSPHPEQDNDVPDGSPHSIANDVDAAPSWSAERHSPQEELEALSDDMLLAWSRSLDFDSYMEGWKKTATSNGSEGTLPIGRSRFRNRLGIVY